MKRLLENNMIKSLFIILILLGINPSFADSKISSRSIKWYGNYEKALLLAKKQNKPIMLFIRKDQCADCQKMFTTTFLNQDYIKMINEKYISIIATYEGKNDYPIEIFYTLNFPATFFIKSKDQSFIIDPLIGYITPKKFREAIVQ